MAVLNKIRQRSFFLIMIIALALFAFIIGDLVRSGGFGGQKAQKTIGEINGEEIKTSEFQALVDNQRRSGSDMQAVRNVWNQKVNGLLTGQRANDAGIIVDREHLNEELARRYANDPSLKDDDGNFSLEKLQELILEMKETDRVRYNNWTNNEGEIAKDVAGNVYLNMVKAGLGATINEGELAYKMENDKINISYVQLPYTSVDDKEVEVSKSEILAYINAHKTEYKRDAYADIEYVKIDEVATLEDEKAISTELAKLVNDSDEFNNVTKQTEKVLGFINTKNVEEFVNENSAIKYVDKYEFKSKLNTDVATNLFDAELGKVYGPYKDGAYIKLSKLIAETKIPDSVKASHILVAYKGLQFAGPDVTRTKEEAKKLADSVLTVVSKKSSKFEELAASLSADRSNKDKGGDLGYFTPGRMVPAFNDYVFENKTGDVGVVETQFGFHVIKIEDQKNIQKAVKIATIAQKIEPSEKTINEIYAKSTKFVIDAREKGFEAAAKEENLTTKPVTKMGELDENIPGIGKQRQIVRWAFDKETKKGAIKSFDLPSGYVIAKLTAVEKAGLMNVEEASAKVSPILKNEKKAKILKAKISGASLEEIAKATNTTVKSASAITMKNSTISGAGIEKKVVGTAFALDVNAVSKPVEGNKGVYVVKVTSKTPGQGLASYQGLANKKAEDEARKAQGALLSALKEKAEIEDKRAVLY
ncbi:peptidylprolyl isomerase [Aquimarina agarilytica]|uniref:peptidylprolyl isomerase n=1 Tax=Aquimarina agarilytica TaxID=1087449 RepID=UPI000289BDA4|nr:peptidylprolyl isomerase [Aquimarina agarilytica]